jgi:RNA polymerase primary sigma factor
LLTRKSEIALGRHSSRKSVVAKEIIFKANIPLVIFVAKKYQGMGLSLPELVQSGFPGLLKSINRYNHKSGNRFGTFATWWIRQNITRELSNTGRTIRLPVNRGMVVNKLLKNSQHLDPLGNQNDLELLAKNVGLPPKHVQDLLESAQIPHSLESPYTDQDDSEDRAWEEITADQSQSVEDSSINTVLIEQIKMAIDALPAKEARILMMSLGLVNHTSLPLRTIAAKLDMSPEGVRQIKERALYKIRKLIS